MHSKSSSRLSSLLDLVQISARNKGYSPYEIRQLFSFAPKSSGKHESVLIPINELTRVFQIEFAVPIALKDQELLLKKYGNKSGDINIQFLFSDIGMWDETDGSTDNYIGETSRELVQQRNSGQSTSYSNQMSSIRHDMIAPEITKPPRIAPDHRKRNTSAYSEDDDDKFDHYEQSQNHDASLLNTSDAFGMFSDLVSQTSKAIEDLSDMHYQIENRCTFPVLLLHRELSSVCHIKQQ